MTWPATKRISVPGQELPDSLPTEPIRVVVVAELIPGGTMGGVEQAVIGLASGLSHLTDSEDDYIFTVPRAVGAWLAPYVGPRGRIVERAGETDPRASLPLLWVRGRRRLVTAARESMQALHDRYRAAGHRPLRRPALRLEQSDGFYEALAPHVLHFPFQHMVLSPLPTIFTPHDLQHRHYPEFFGAEEVRVRDYFYRSWCRRATAVETSSHWARNDVITQYGLNPSKVHAIVRSAPVSLYGWQEVSPEVLRRRFQLPECFCLFPAQTWPHKNHARLLEALALIRARDGERIHLVCTGAQNAFWPQIAELVRELGLEDSVSFLGFVAPGDLRALYRAAEFVVYPTLFEGGGFPVLEALAEEAPLACSRVTALPEQVGDAALLFDPSSVDDIAAAVRAMHRDAHLRATLRENGKHRMQYYTWSRAAKHFRALYRTLAGRGLTAEDHALLAAGQQGG